MQSVKRAQFLTITVLSALFMAVGAAAKFGPVIVHLRNDILIFHYYILY